MPLRGGGGTDLRKATASECFSQLSKNAFDGAIHREEHRMNRKAKLLAGVAIVALVPVFGLGEEKDSDASINEIRVP